MSQGYGSNAYCNWDSTGGSSASITDYRLNKVGIYIIRARGDNYSGGQTGQYTISLTVTPFDMPLNLSVSNVTGKPRALLTWEDKTDSESGFRIERNQDEGGWGCFAELPANTTSYTCTTLAGNTSYWYTVYAYGCSGQSAYSSETSVTTE